MGMRQCGLLKAPSRELKVFIPIHSLIPQIFFQTYERFLVPKVESHLNDSMCEVAFTNPV